MFSDQDHALWFRFRQSSLIHLVRVQAPSPTAGWNWTWKPTSVCASCHKSSTSKSVTGTQSLVSLGHLLVFPLPQDRPAVDRSKVIAPCFVFHGWWSGPSPGLILVPALRPSTRVKPLAGGPGASLSHCRALHKNGNPNSGLFSRPRLAVNEREHGLPLGDHQYLASLISFLLLRLECWP